MATVKVTVKVTVTLEGVQLAAIKGEVAAGRANNISAFVQRAVAAELAQDTAWARELADALDRTGGPMTEGERAWADDFLGSTTRDGATAA